MAKNRKSKAGVSKNYYSYLQVNKAKRWFVRLSVSFFFAIITAFIFLNLNMGKDWFYIALPIIIVGFIIVAIPEGEEWVYEPWQSKARIYERER